MEIMKIVNMSVGQIRPYQKNPRHNASAIAKVAEQIKAVGWQQPIVVDKDHVIIVGHTRYLAALSLGQTKVPVKVASELTPAQAKAYRIADNKTAEFSTWDDALLKGEMFDLSEIEAADLTAFDAADIRKILADPEPVDVRKPDDEYGGATALQRGGGAPFRYWKKHKLLNGQVLDFGAGKEEHNYARYDSTVTPAVDVLRCRYDSIMCNYVLNVQPTDHLIDLILALLYHLVEDKGHVLVAVVAEAALDNTPTCGGRLHKSRSDWRDILARHFKVIATKGNFCGFVCNRLM